MKQDRLGGNHSHKFLTRSSTLKANIPDFSLLRVLRFLLNPTSYKYIKIMMRDEMMELESNPPRTPNVENKLESLEIHV